MAGETGARSRMQPSSTEGGALPRLVRCDSQRQGGLQCRGRGKTSGSAVGVIFHRLRRHYRTTPPPRRGAARNLDSVSNP